MNMRVFSSLSNLVVSGAGSSIYFNYQFKLIGQTFPINFKWRFCDFTSKFNRQLHLINDDATKFI